jgi:hypothetical protein
MGDKAKPLGVGALAEYRVKSANEPHERAVREGELSDVP